MKILRIYLRRLHNEEWFGFFTEFKELAPLYSTDKLGITVLYERFLELHRSADEALVVLRKSIYTKELDALDRTRGDIVRGLSSVVKGYLRYPSADKEKAAGRLDILLGGYKKDIFSSTNLAETAAIGNLIDDLATEQYSGALKTLNLNEWFTALATAELEYQTTLKERFDESTEKPKEDLTKIRPKLGAIYNAMVSVLDTRLILDGLGGDIVVDPKTLDGKGREPGEKFNPEEHGNLVYNFVQAWNERVKKARDILSRRDGEPVDEDTDTDEAEDLPSES
jgi:hypothetical protein